MKYLALILINLYQRFISPHKGFSCAYRVHTGRVSCSVLGYRSIRFFGFWRGLFVLRQRLIKCGVAHRRYLTHSRIYYKQAGFCDLPCDLPCDVPSIDFHHCHGGDVCDVLTNCTPCDCGDWRSKKEKNEEKLVHIPPNINYSSKEV